MVVGSDTPSGGDADADDLLNRCGCLFTRRL